MPNINSVLNDQIRRLARREIRANTGVVRRATAQYRHDIATLKKKVSSLTKVTAFLEKQEKRRVAERPVVAPQEDVRFRADGLKSNRAKLGLSASDFGLLVGVTGQTIYDWESGKSRPRNKEVVARISAVRGIGKREALKRLELLDAPVGQPSQRGQFAQTAREFILSLVKSKKATTSAQINAAWAKAGRRGVASPDLTGLVKARKLKRTKLIGEKGSRYSVR